MQQSRKALQAAKEPPERIGPMRSASLALGPHIPPYLVLLRVGFTLPPTLPPERCALAAPFHPYPGAEASMLAQGRPQPGGRGVTEAVSFLWH